MEYNTKNLRILLMDDEEQILFIGKEMIEYLDHQADIAHNGEEALEMLNKAQANGVQFDLVIMDLTIPGFMGGKELISIIRENKMPVRAIVTSGYSNDPVMSDYKKYGFNSFLIKPFNLESLENAINNAVKND
jgi:CheY-like chemotaxis protein